MRGITSTYPVKLSEEQQRLLEAMIEKGKSEVSQPAGGADITAVQPKPGKSESQRPRNFPVAGSQPSTGHSNQETLLSGRTGGALGHKYPRERKRLDGQGEAALTVLACSQVPEVHDHWTIRLLAKRLVGLEIVGSISPETVRQTLVLTQGDGSPATRGRAVSLSQDQTERVRRLKGRTHTSFSHGGFPLHGF